MNRHLLMDDQAFLVVNVGLQLEKGFQFCSTSRERE